MKPFNIILFIATALLFSCCQNSIVIEDFENGIDHWSIEGSAFKSTSEGGGVTGLAGSHYLANLDDDTLSGSATSPSFTIEKKYINALVAGNRSSSYMRAMTSVQLIVDGEVVASTGSISSDQKTFEWVSFDVEDYAGKQATVKINVEPARSYGNNRLPRGVIMVDQIEMSDKKLSNFMANYSTKVEIDNNYIMIPGSTTGSNSSLSVEIDGENILGRAQSVRVATESIDYYIPVNVEKFRGKTALVNLTGVKTTDAVYGAIATAEKSGYPVEETYRPVYHFAPEFGWTNDPNGMVRTPNGEWHLSFQYNPYGTTHGNMHWGLSVSKDLIHWEDKPAVIAPDELGSIFSGSAVLDKDNTANFGKDAIVGIYTSAGNGQKQSIAYSLDGGYNFVKYDANPVLVDETQRDFRDPKVSWIGDQWVMALASGQVIRFYGSKNLKEWYFLSDFGTGYGSHDGVWECPDLLRFDYNGKEKWVLLVSINPGGPNGGSITQYFIGDFDGKSFKADKLPYPLWIDSGVDNYAGVTFANTGDRNVFMGWMSNWVYSGQTPTTSFRNSMTIARDLFLKSNGQHTILASMPSPEIYAARFSEKKVNDSAVVKDFEVSPILDSNTGAYEINATVTPDAKKSFDFILSNSKGEKMVFTFDLVNNKLILDRSQSGQISFSPSFAAKPIVVDLIPRKEYKLQLFVDKMSTELFINDGDMVFTNSAFPTEPYNAFKVNAKDCQVNVRDITIYELK